MVSVCMATFNGEKFVKKQIESILPQLNPEDELIISDDGSTDSTLKIVSDFDDSRIRIFKNSFRNVVKNFEFAINKSNGEYIFLSDQDDIWHQDKVAAYLKYFKESNADLIVSDVAFIDAHGNTTKDEFFPRGFKGGTLSNLKKNNFIGCAMAFKEDTKKWFLPFPTDTPMHDWWIGLAIGKKGMVRYLDRKLIYYRRHHQNVTSGKKSTLPNIIRWRWILIKNLC